MKSILWLCDQRESGCDNVSQQIADALSERTPLEYTHAFAYYSDPPHVTIAMIKQADLIMCSHPAVIGWLQSLNVRKPTLLQFSTTEPNSVLDELIKMTAASGGKERQKAEPKQIGQSLPLGTQKWAEIFGVSENTIRKWREEKKKYHFEQVSKRRWTLPINELPAEYIQKYRHAIPQTQPKAQ